MRARSTRSFAAETARANRDRRIREDSAMAPSRVALVTLAVGAPYVAGGLWLDRYVDLHAQLALGLLTAVVFAGLLTLQTRAVRLQAVAVVGVATMGEIVGSIIWGVYTYRLGNLPAFVPPGHGLVYLCGYSLAMLAVRRPQWLLGIAIAGTTLWGVLGMTALPATDLSGAIGATFLVLVLLKTRRAVYAGVFLAVAALEIYGTAIGTWTWEGVVPVLEIPQGNPPSGAASGYVVFDVVAIWLTTRVSRATLRGIRTRVQAFASGV
jgi:hypothetical protein